MTNRMTTSFFEVLVFLCLGPLLSGSVDGAAREPRLPSDVPGLIGALASPNTPPTVGWPNEPRYPQGFDHAVQKRVLAARQALEEKGAAAFPDLIGRLSDARYSCTASYAAWVNLTVGNVCGQIVEDQVVSRHDFSYKSRMGQDGRQHGHQSYMGAQGGLEKWWSTHSTQSLREMKIEALQWAIAREENVGFPRPNDRKYHLEPLQTELRELQSPPERRLIDRTGEVPKRSAERIEHPQADQAAELLRAKTAVSFRVEIDSPEMAGFVKHWTLGSESAWFNASRGEVLVTGLTKAGALRIAGFPKEFGRICATGWEDGNRFFVHVSRDPHSGTMIYCELKKQQVSQIKHWTGW